jgi:prolyl 4-hydroxylase
MILYNIHHFMITTLIFVSTPLLTVPMTYDSAPSCQSCANIDFDTRCPKRPSDEKPALLPGQLNKMFERIIANAPGNQTDETQLFAKEKKVQEDGTPYYTVHVHSRPESVGDMDQTMTVQDGAFSTKVSEASRDQDLKEKPWVVTFENFLTDEECDHLVQLGHDNVYSRSKDVGTKMADGSYSAKESTTRTSENAWCSAKTGCRNDDIATRVRDRISKLVQIQSRNFEDFQMLKYDEGQFYALHHDYIPHQVDRASGPRILTFFLYLSDVEEGGGTGLNRINEGLVVNPKKGKALLWPSVLNYDPTVKDGRTTHEAIAVVKGTKFAANAWIHLYDNVETQKRGCT